LREWINIYNISIIYDVFGDEITTLVKNEKPVNTHAVEFDAAFVPGGLSSGLYFYQLSVRPSTGSGRQVVATKKIILLKYY
jgi:hypothetical protein